MPATVVCLSGLRWAGMHEVARRTADALGFALVDEEIVLRAAAEAGIDPKVVAGVEARQSLLERMLGAIALSAEPMHVAYAPGSTTHADVPPSDALRDLIRAAIEETAARGQVVIVSHAASHALAARTDVLRVLVTATAEARRARLVEEHGPDAANPERALAESDAARADYLRRFYGVREELPSHYDLVLNTERLDADTAAGLVVLAASR